MFLEDHTTIFKDIPNIQGKIIGSCQQYMGYGSGQPNKQQWPLNCRGQAPL
ncbi:hypothetical protein PtB15_3B544 [Puccinia triticina]|nr:hypothetical protein PtB15_3B544 [Puccinia triticina]